MKRNGIGFLTLVMRRSPVRVRSLAPYFAPDSSDSGAFVCHKSGEQTLFLHLLQKSGMDTARLLSEMGLKVFVYLAEARRNG